MCAILCNCIDQILVMFLVLKQQLAQHGYIPVSNPGIWEAEAGGGLPAFLDLDCRLYRMSQARIA